MSASVCACLVIDVYPDPHSKLPSSMMAGRVENRLKLGAAWSLRPGCPEVSCSGCCLATRAEGPILCCSQLVPCMWRCHSHNSGLT